MRKLAVFGLIALLAGCAAAENPNAQSAREICAIAYGDPALEPVRNRIPWDDDAAVKAAMHFLADQDKPNDAERAALQALDSANRRCWDAWEKAGRSPVVQSARSTVSAALAELYTGKITYGEFNRRRANAIADMRARLKEAEDRERAAYYSRNRGFMFCDAFGRAPFLTMHCW